jgi:hypothetical protein
MKFQDTLFNWLQIHIVACSRSGDQAARDTEAFFAEMLREDHGLEQFSIGLTDETMYHVHYMKEGKTKIQMFDREAAEQLLADIEANPKYNE